MADLNNTFLRLGAHLTIQICGACDVPIVLFLFLHLLKVEQVHRRTGSRKGKAPKVFRKAGGWIRVLHTTAKGTGVGSIERFMPGA